MKVLHVVVVSYLVVKAAAEGDAPPITELLGKCDFANDCDNDSDCSPGLLCADDHKDSLGKAGYDERTADCIVPETANKYWEVCFDASILYPPSGGGFGDPHFQTYDGTQYSFHGECDLVMARSASFGDNLGLTVHARTKMVDNWSLISNAAIRIGDDVFEVVNDNTHYYNGVKDVEFPILLAGQYTVTKSVSQIAVEYAIELGNKESITIMNFKSMLSVRVNAYLAETEGMLGRQNKKGMIARDEATVVEDPNQMGAEWQVRDTESMLFHEIRTPQYPQQCTLPEVKSRRLRMTVADYEQAEKACMKVRESMRQFCIEDVIQTGDVTMATTYVSFNSATAF